MSGDLDLDDVSSGHPVAMQELADLRAALANERARGIHTCHDRCDRPMCVLRRRVADLERSAGLDAVTIEELLAERETFIKHLTAIERVSNDSRSQSRRMQYITARARSAINGDKEWLGIPRPRKGTKEGTIEHLQDANSSLRRENERLTAERDRLWAWHDEAVSRVSCHLCAVNLPQPLKREK